MNIRIIYFFLLAFSKVFRNKSCNSIAKTKVKYK